MSNSAADPFGLSPLWNALLAIYKAFSEICDRYGLRYYVTDGNAIGAVRHHGFIPWDDDFDVSMPRPDYERFIAIAGQELPAYLKVVNWRNTPEFDCMFLKIQDVRRERVLEVEEKVGYQLSNGIFIDIFPIDGYPESKVAEVWYLARMKCLWLLKRYYAETLTAQTPKGKVAWIIGWLISLVAFKIRSNADCLEMADILNQRDVFGETKMCGRSATTMWKRVVIPTETYGTPVYFDFTDGVRVPLPHDFDTYLSYDYPNYMTLPPEEKRRPSHTYAKRCAWWLGPTMGEA